jgi:hypothetical protein
VYSRPKTVYQGIDNTLQIFIKNKDKNPDDAQNKFRCAYAKACNVNWTDVGCSI